MLLWLNKYPALDENDLLDLERRAHEIEATGIGNEAAEKAAFCMYKGQSLMNGATFHAKSYRHFEQLDPKLAMAHRAILALYSACGIDISPILQNPYHYDVESLEVGPINHKADKFVLSLE